ncbi:MAG TPA: diguanylate cyclase [Ilumatobacter sp.]|nr:diguanylate cyclase [Ilumatobacter sp.]
MSNNRCDATVANILVETDIDAASAPDLVTGFLSLMAAHPDAWVAAIGEAGILVPMPPTVPLDRHRVVVGRSLLDMVLPEDKVAVINSWDASGLTGSLSMTVRLLTDPDQPIRVTLVDAVERFGVRLAIMLPADGARGRLASSSFDGTPLPRTARVRKDARAMITDVDHATTQILGWAPEHIVDRRSLELIHPDDQDRAISNWMEMLTAPGQSQRVRLRHLTADGAWVWMEITNHNHLEDDEPYVLAEMLDISEELAAQEALRASEQRLRRLAEALPLGVIQIRTDRTISYANERTAAITGVAAAESIDAQFDNVLPADRVLLDNALEAVLDGHDQDLSIRFRAPDTVRHEILHTMVSMRATTNTTGAVTDAIVSVADVSEQVRMTAELKRRATYDALTGCLNRSALMARLDEALRDPGVGVGLVYLDLDEFKEINDERGHAAGDAVLRGVASRLAEAVRVHDLIGRLGGDEFVVVCRDIADRDGALQVGTRIEAALARGVAIRDERVVVSASVGVAHTTDPATSSDRLIAEADTQMYTEKRRRKRSPEHTPNGPTVHSARLHVV